MARETEAKAGVGRTVASDLVNNLSSAALYIGAAVLFFAGAAAGIGLVSRLGGAGWFMYCLVIGTYALVFGPIIAWAHKLRQDGSPKYRRDLEARREVQRKHFGLHLYEGRDRETAGPRVAQARPRTPSDASASQGPAETDTSVTNPGRASSGGDRIR